MSLFVREERRDLGWPEVYGSEGSALIGPGTVTKLAPVYGAVSLIADEFSSTPFRVEQETNDGEQEPVQAPLILLDPDPYLSEMDWRYQAVVSLKLRGNAYGLVDPGRRYCRWIHPDWVIVDESNPLKPRYYVNGVEQIPVKRGGSLLHVREFVQPGTVKGLSPIQHFMSTFDTANLANEFGRKWFRNASVPPAILQSKTARMDPDKLREARDDFVEATSEGKPVALPGEWEWTKISLTADEAQFLNTIEASATTIATIFRVPAEDIGGKAGNSRTYSNREMDQELFNIRTLLPLGQRLGQALSALLPTGQRVVYDLDFLAQPGQLESARADTEELRNGTLRLSEARRRRGRKPLTDEEIEQWQQWYATTKSESESDAKSYAYSMQEGTQ